MDAYRLSSADDLLAELVSRAEAGNDIDLIREGQIVARIVAVPAPARSSEPFDWAAYRASIDGMAAYDGNSVVDMRRDARY